MTTPHFGSRNGANAGSNAIVSRPNRSPLGSNDISPTSKCHSGRTMFAYELRQSRWVDVYNL